MVTMDEPIPLGHSIPADTHHVRTTHTQSSTCMLVLPLSEELLFQEYMFVRLAQTLFLEDSLSPPINKFCSINI